MDKHITPTPWRFQEHKSHSTWLGNIIGSYGKDERGIENIRTISCQTKYESETGEARANADFIVEAVNNHDRLTAEVGMLRELTEKLLSVARSCHGEPTGTDDCDTCVTMRKAMEALNPEEPK